MVTQSVKCSGSRKGGACFVFTGDTTILGLQNACDRYAQAHNGWLISYFSFGIGWRSNIRAGSEHGMCPIKTVTGVEAA